MCDSRFILSCSAEKESSDVSVEGSITEPLGLREVNSSRDVHLVARWT